MSELNFRQIHLDFHTSEKIENIGEKFDKKEWQETLKLGHVDSITIFSKCHHGWSYHPTKVNEMHPHLKFDLLKEEMEASKEIGVKTPVYISAGLDEKEAVRHPEWLSRQADETTTWVNGFVEEAGFHLMCFNTGYMDLLLAQIEEVMQTYNPEGIFLDIVSVHPCYCSKCRQDILDRGKDPRDFEAVMEQAEIVYKNYAKKVEEVVRKYSDTCTIFHNAGHITRGRRDLADYDTHLELESLPTGGWGYDHFPMSAAYVRNLGKEYLGMTGKFHTSWGEFGGFKHPNALRYETGLLLALGAKCSVGDQLHPLGKLDRSTYELIGKAYKEVEEKEEWCKGTRNISDVAVLGEEAVNASVSNRDEQRCSDIGVNRILLEGKYLYSFIDLKSDFSDYKVIILPDSIRLDESLKTRLQEYIKDGGKVLATGASGLDKEKCEFVLDMGVEYVDKSSYNPDYLVPGFDLTTGRSPHIMYGQSYKIKQTKGTAFAEKEDTYFNRDTYSFCSHQHTPNNPNSREVAAVLTDNTAYISWDIFSDYAKKGSLHDKEMVMYALDHLLGENKTLKTKFPDRGVTTLTYQEEKDRYVQHFVFAHTTIRGRFTFGGATSNVEVIEDIVPVYDTEVSVKIDKKVEKLYLAPQMEELEFVQKDDVLTYVVPKIDCHQMVVIEFNRESM